MKSSLARTIGALALAAIVAAVVGNLVGNALVFFSYGEVFGLAEVLNGIWISILVVLAIGVLVIVPIHYLFLSRCWPSAWAYGALGFCLGCALTWSLVGWFSPEASPRVIVEIGAACVAAMVACAVAFHRVVGLSIARKVDE